MLDRWNSEAHHNLTRLRYAGKRGGIRMDHNLYVYKDLG
jgi:hypothetical protein